MLKFPNKKIRSGIIADYVRLSGYRGCVCFSCGNASSELKKTGLFVVDISPTGDLQSTRWWLPEEIKKTWPDLFDATSGHLPAFLMVRIGQEFKNHLGPLVGGSDIEPIQVPTGSGETIQCLRWAYPDVEFIPVFNCGRGTDFNNQAPLLPAILRGREPRL